MAVKYSGLLRFTDGIKAEIDLTADGTVEKAVIIDGDGDETPIGGGGSSDFTTAEVTITNNTESDIEIALPSIRGHGNDMYMIGTTLAVPNSSKSHIVVLYKGAAAGFVITDNVPSAVCTGDISISSIAGTHFNITGNGTITFGTASEG